MIEATTKDGIFSWTQRKKRERNLPFSSGKKSRGPRGAQTDFTEEEKSQTLAQRKKKASMVECCEKRIDLLCLRKVHREVKTTPKSF